VLNSVTNLIPSWKGPEARDKKLLEPAGGWVMQGFIGGIKDQLGPLKRTLTGITNLVPDTVTANTEIVSASILPAQRIRDDATATPTTTVAPNITQNVYNPVAEPTSVSTTKGMTRLAQLGVFGG
jgi:phage-related protein